jgi:folate-binding protein YgfZ
MGQGTQDAGVVALSDRGIVAIGGEDRTSFLQGLVSNDVSLATAGHVVFAALLTPQGRFLHAFHVVALGDRLLLDCEGGRRDDLIRRLRPYRLRSKVTLDDATGAWRVAALPGPSVLSAVGLAGAAAGDAVDHGGGRAYVDPRLAALGARLLLPAETAEATLAALGLPRLGADVYRDLRLRLGVPEDAADLALEKAILLENGFDEMNAVSWTKGCWMGQELTARTRYRGLVKKRLLPVRIEGAAPPPGTPLTLGPDGPDAGEMRSSLGDRGLALVRLEALAAIGSGAAVIRAGEAVIHPTVPDWVRLPGTAG